MDCRCNRNNVTAYHIAAGGTESIGLDIKSDSDLSDVESIISYFTAEQHPSIEVGCITNGNHAVVPLTAEQTSLLGEYAADGYSVHMCTHIKWKDGTDSPILFGGSEKNPIYELPIKMITCHRC